MQTTEQHLTVQVSPADRNSQVLDVDIDHNGSELLSAAEADEIFTLAEAEIQPILKQMRKDRFIGWVQGFICVSLILFPMAGIIWQCITYPHTLVVLYAREKPASITTTLDVPTRTLAPVTVTRSATTAATGKGHQDARAASGILTFYNGNFSPQSIPVGTVFTGTDGVKIATSEAVTLPAAQPPQFAIGSVSAYALSAGSKTDIAAGDINLALSSSLLVKNLSSFTGGRDARDYQAVAAQDLQTLNSTVNETLTQAFLTAFPLRQGEEAIPTHCHTTTTPNHREGQEAQSVTLTVSKTCSAMAYHSQELTRQAIAAFRHTKPAANYHIVGSLRTVIHSVSPFFVTIYGTWIYTFSQDYEQLLAQQIAGDTPAQARKVLIRTGVISDASIPTPLPPAMYIDFLVLS